MATKLDRTKLVRNLAARYKLVPHLDKAIGKGDFEWTYAFEPKGEDTAWHPSSHCTPSLRELYQYALTSTPNQDHPADGSAPIAKNRREGFTPALYKTFQVGHFWHQYLQYLIEHKLEFCEPWAVERDGVVSWGSGKMERDIYPLGVREPIAQINSVDWAWVKGSGDIAPCTIPELGEYLIDFKTMKSIDFKAKKPPAWAVDKWECQVNVYMDFFDLEKTLVIGILKDSPHDLKEFEFHRNQPLIDALYEKWQLVSACVAEGIEPPEGEEVKLPLKGPK